MISRYEHFSSVISGIYRCIQKIERDEMEKYGYKGAFAQYLAAMKRYPEGLTSVQLTEICDRDKAAISRAVAEMEEKGLIEREGTAYRARLRLTEAGLRAAQFVCERAQSAVEAVSKDLTTSELDAVYASLSVIASNLEAVSKEGIPEN